MRRCHSAPIPLVTGLLLALATISPVTAATPPDPSLQEPLAVPKPAELPLRLPWADGESHPIGDWYYNPDNSIQPSETNGGYDHTCNPGGHPQDCYALDFVNMTRDTAIYPAFAGTVVYAGCATGGWWHYGQIVYIERKLGDNHVYGALYTHLTTITPVVRAAAHSNATISANTQLGTAGNTVTVGTECSNPDPKGMVVHLHFALYRDAIFRPGTDGGPHDGVAVIPEPFVGQDVYENFLWWRKDMTATDLLGGNANPLGWWLSDASGASTALGLLPAPLPFNQAAKFHVHVEDPQVDIKEVHFTVYYPGWNETGEIQPKALSFEKDWPFPADKIWRIVAICRPTDTNADPTKCHWNGSARSADVSFEWFPSLEHGVVQPLVPWLTSAKPVQFSSSSSVLELKMSFDVISRGGVEKLAPAGVRSSVVGMGFALQHTRSPEAAWQSDDRTSTHALTALPACNWSRKRSWREPTVRLVGGPMMSRSCWLPNLIQQIAFHGEPR